MSPTVNSNQLDPVIRVASSYFTRIGLMIFSIGMRSPMTENLQLKVTPDVPEEDYEVSKSFPEYIAQEESRTKKLPSPDKVFLNLPEAAAILDISPSRMRSAIYNGHCRSKRSSKARRARFLIHRDWLEEYQGYINSPTLMMRIKVWFRKQF